MQQISIDGSIFQNQHIKNYSKDHSQMMETQQIIGKLEKINKKQNLIGLNQNTLNQMNNLLLKICQQVEGHYKHGQNIYNYAHQILKYISSNSVKLSTHQDVITIICGKTGWGKSTVTNILNGAKFKVDETGQIYPDDYSQIKTVIGNGKGSTTLFPVYVQTCFGKVFDLPGDDQTRGIIPQIINAISKKNLGRILKKIKLMIVVPASIFTSQGSYGSEFKKFLVSTDKFLGGLNKYSKNTILLVNFCQRFPKSLEKVKQSIRSCLNHEDGQLKKYQQFILNILSDNRIKLISKPSSDSEDYTAPTLKEWQQQSIQKIIQAIQNTPHRICQQNEFSVPFNQNNIQKLSIFLKVFTQKAKNLIQNSVKKLEIAGIQLTFVYQLLQQILNSKNLSLRQFLQKFTFNNYFFVENIDEVHKQINFISQFILDNGNISQEYIGNWMTQKFVNKINVVLQEIRSAILVNKLNFRKKIQFQNLIVQPNSKFFLEIDKYFKDLQQLRLNFQQAQIQSQDHQSLFYDDTIEKVFDKIIYQPYEIDQTYYEQQIQPKLYKVQKPKQEWIDVPKQRLSIIVEDETYQVDVKRVRKIPKEQTIVEQIKGQRKYLGVAGPRQKTTKTTYKSVQIDEVYFEKQTKTRKVQVPYIQNYTQKEKRIYYVEEQEWRNQKVQVQKTRKRIQYNQKTLFKDVTRRIFNSKKYQKFIYEITEQMRIKQQKIKQIIQDRVQQRVILPFKLQLDDECCKTKIEKQYLYLFYIWHCLEQEALAIRYPNKNINNGKDIIRAD